jgi:hypothetical protein
MGIGPEAETLMRSAPYYSIHWMTGDELLSTKFITSRSTGSELLPSADTPATALASPSATAVETPANSAASGTVQTPGNNLQASHQGNDRSKEACEKWSGQECKMYGGRWLAPSQYGGRPKPPFSRDSRSQRTPPRPGRQPFQRPITKKAVERGAGRRAACSI